MAADSVPRKFASKWSNRYRGAVVEDLEPPAALSLHPGDPISLALDTAYSREYTHLTIVGKERRTLVGYVSIPHLNDLLNSGECKPEDPLENAMMKFNKKGRSYKLITLLTPLEELEAFFRGWDEAAPEHEVAAALEEQGDGQWKQTFAVVTDYKRRFVLGVATVDDLVKFVERRAI